MNPLLVVMVGRRSGWGSGRGCGLEAVGVAFGGDDVGVVDESVDHRGGDGVVSEDLPQRPKSLLLVTIRDARS